MKQAEIEAAIIVIFLTFIGACFWAMCKLIELFCGMY